MRPAPTTATCLVVPLLSLLSAMNPPSCGMFHDPSRRKDPDESSGNLHALERVCTRCPLHADPTELRELLQRRVASESTPATILHSPKGHLRLIMNRLI